MIPEICSSIAPMFHAGRIGFNAPQFASGDTVAWTTSGNRGRHLPEEHENLGYTPAEYFTVDTDRQSELAVDFINEHVESIRRLSALGIPMIVYLQKATLFTHFNLVDLVHTPLELIRIAAKFDIGISTIFYFKYIGEDSSDEGRPARI